jgi:hypothetical protein
MAVSAGLSFWKVCMDLNENHGFQEYLMVSSAILKQIFYHGCSNIFMWMFWHIGFFNHGILKKTFWYEK